jgi:hypothetical protein
MLKTFEIFIDVHDCDILSVPRLNSAYGNLTVRSLLDTREQFLNEFQFSDPYALVSALILCECHSYRPGMHAWYFEEYGLSVTELFNYLFDY